MVVQYGVKVYRVRVDKKTFFALPMKLADAPATLDEIISLMYRYAKAFELKQQSKKEVRRAFSSAVKLLNIEIEDRELRLLERNFDTLLQLIDTKRNSIWTFILRNIYKPIALSHRKFDYLVGNLPWLSMRYMKDPDYQEFLKSESVKYGLVDKKSVHLLGLIELASLFFKKTVDIYLKPKGTITFVMPKGTLLASQHVNFRKFESVNVISANAELTSCARSRSLRTERCLKSRS